MEDPFFQTELLLHVNLELAENQIVCGAGTSYGAGNASPEKHRLLAGPLTAQAKRLRSLLRHGGNLGCGGDFRSHVAAHCTEKQRRGDTPDHVCQDGQDSGEGTPLRFRTFCVDIANRFATRR
jgi:hypothetical protein